jgi:hypothetical protein
VANKLWAMPRSQDAGSLSLATLGVAIARFRSSLLLKTNLPRPKNNSEATAGCFGISIAVSHFARNAPDGFGPQVLIFLSHSRSGVSRCCRKEALTMFVVLILL